jgi:hypothetical protein
LRPAPGSALGLALLLAGCAANPQQSCAPGEQAAVLDQLYLGTGRPHGPDVSAAEWAAFVSAEIAPRFPQGFSLQEAQGQWRNADGSVAHELSHLLMVVHPDDAASAQAMRDIAEHYKQRFNQEAVLRLRAAACMSL